MVGVPGAGVPMGACHIVVWWRPGARLGALDLVVAGAGPLHAALAFMICYISYHSI